jgi:hypothetical protein
MKTVAALFVNPEGAYAGLPDVEVWDAARDARSYGGPHPVVAHPPCQRWGRYWHGTPNKPHQFDLGADQGCFAVALWAVRTFGGVLEHPAHSEAWDWYGIMPPLTGGWHRADSFGGCTCSIEGHFGHLARKGTWLYAAHVELPSLPWGRGAQRLPAGYVERVGYEKARRTGVMAAVGGKAKTQIREATPPEFRDLLLSIARTSTRNVEAAA